MCGIHAPLKLPFWQSYLDLFFSLRRASFAYFYSKLTQLYHATENLQLDQQLLSGPRNCATLWRLRKWWCSYVREQPILTSGVLGCSTWTPTILNQIYSFILTILDVFGTSQGYGSMHRSRCHFFSSFSFLPSLSSSVASLFQLIWAIHMSCTFHMVYIIIQCYVFLWRVEYIVYFLCITDVILIFCGWHYTSDVPL